MKYLINSYFLLLLLMSLTAYGLDRDEFTETEPATPTDEISTEEETCPYPLHPQFFYDKLGQPVHVICRPSYADQKAIWKERDYMLCFEEKVIEHFDTYEKLEVLLETIDINNIPSEIQLFIEELKESQCGYGNK